MRLEKVLEGNLCLGCGLCTSIVGPDRAAMRQEPGGYLRPHVTGPLTEDEDKLIDLVCPGGRLDQDPARAGSPEWGPIIGRYTGYARDETLRFRASSGGGLSAVLRDLLESSAAEYVLHVGASRETPWLNELAESSAGEDILRRAGSRYAPSAPLQDIVQRLDDPSPFV